MVAQPYNSRWDLLVCDRKGQLTLIVQVKSKIGTSIELVSSWRRNMLVHEILPSIPYFLFAFPDKFYLWKNNSTKTFEHKEPDYTIDASSILKPYLKGSSIKGDRIRESSLEIIVAAWLNNIAYSEANLEELKQSHSWLIDSGLYSSLQGGKVISGATA